MDCKPGDYLLVINDSGVEGYETIMYKGNIVEFLESTSAPASADTLRIKGCGPHIVWYKWRLIKLSQPTVTKLQKALFNLP